MSGVSRWLKDRLGTGRIVYWLAVPLLLFPFCSLIVAVEDDTSSLSLFVTAGCAALSGGICRYAKGWFWEAPLAGAWFPTLVVWTRIHWRLGLSSPAGASQSFARWAFGLNDLSPTEAAAVCLAAAGTAGYAFAAANLFWKRLTGRSLTSYLPDD